MNYQELKKKFLTRKGAIIGKYCNASVLVPLLELEGKIHLLFEVRASHLTVQPDEISFPGGRVEKGESYQEAACRETMEELCLRRQQIEIFGELDYLFTPYNLIIYPFIGFLKNISTIEELKSSKSEVAKVFTVPLDFFLNHKPAEYQVEIHPYPCKGFPYHLIKNGRDYNWRNGKYPVYFYHYNEYIIWGITARILRNFLEIYHTGTGE